MSWLLFLAPATSNPLKTKNNRLGVRRQLKPQRWCWQKTRFIEIQPVKQSWIFIISCNDSRKKISPPFSYISPHTFDLVFPFLVSRCFFPWMDGYWEICDLKVHHSFHTFLKSEEKNLSVKLLLSNGFFRYWYRCAEKFVTHQFYPIPRH